MTVFEEPKECPMCGEKMHRKLREIVDLVPGTSEAKTRVAIEWICPECDYFEEGEEEAME
jgi:rubrerythrin